MLREGEPLRARVTVENRGRGAVWGVVEFALEPVSPTPSAPHGGLAAVRRDVVAEPGRPAKLQVEFPPLPGESDLWQVTARLIADSESIDEMVTGVIRENPAIRAAAPHALVPR